MSKAKLTAGEWEIVRDAPHWVFAGLAAADSKQAILTSRKESKTLKNVLKNYKTSNALIRDVLANEEKAAKAIKKASTFDVEQALGKISQIVENKLGSDNLDAFNDFLLSVGSQVAESAGEKVLGVGEKTSKREAAAMENMSKALRATDADKRSRRQAKEQVERRKRTKATAEAKKAAAEKAKQEKEASEKAATEKQKREVAARAEKRQIEKEKKEAQAKKRVEEKTAMMEARRKDRVEAAQAAREAAEAAKFIAEHTVVSGDNLSFISKKYYGSSTHWKLIHEANKEVIGDNPNLIRIGQVFQIPRLPEG